MFQLENFIGIMCHDIEENLHFYGLILSKAYKVLDEKVQKSYASLHGRVTQRKILEKSQFLRNIHFLCDAVDLN